MKKLSILLFTVISFYSCKKDTTKNTICSACKVSGTYFGSFHQTAACYGCTPHIDTLFTGNFTVDTTANDSIIIKRSYDNYEWKFAYNDTGSYSRWGCCTAGESFAFKQPDSLTYYYNFGGGGGYFNEKFYGKR